MKTIIKFLCIIWGIMVAGIVLVIVVNLIIRIVKAYAKRMNLQRKKENISFREKWLNLFINISFKKLLNLIDEKINAWIKMLEVIRRASSRERGRKLERDSWVAEGIRERAFTKAITQIAREKKLKEFPRRDDKDVIALADKIFKEEKESWVRLDDRIANKSINEKESDDRIANKYLKEMNNADNEFFDKKPINLLFGKCDIIKKGYNIWHCAVPCRYVNLLDGFTYYLPYPEQFKNHSSID